MAQFEIERKYLISTTPNPLSSYSGKKIEQGYLSTNPVVRIRRDDNEFYLTYKGSGKMIREEYNLPLTEESFAHLKPKTDGTWISKTRYLIPLEHPNYQHTETPFQKSEKLIVEVDVFDEPFAPLVLAEIEFSSVEEATYFLPPTWLVEDVTENPAYHNSNMSKQDFF